MNETRAEGTSRVTESISAWLWAKGSRCMVLEVGLHPTKGIARPWDGRWRVDIAATIARDVFESVHIVEVKGSTADLIREDLTTGKWLLDYESLGINPWLAVSDDIEPRHYANLGTAWGILSVQSRGVKIVREPLFKAQEAITKCAYAETHRALAEVQTLQRLPTMMGKSRRQMIAALEAEGWRRPWSSWSTSGSKIPRTKSDREDGGNIL